MNKENDFWSSCDFIHFNHDEINKFNLPETTNKFLLYIGLPKCHDTFDASNIKFYNPSEFQSIIFKGTTFTLIGEMAYSSLVIENSTGQLYIVPLDEENATIAYINSSIETFLEFHEIFYTSLEKAEEFKQESDYMKFVDKVKSEFIKRDPQALYNIENVWSEVLEEYENCAI